MLIAGFGNNYEIDVTTSGASDFILSGSFSGNDPQIDISFGDTITFNINNLWTSILFKNN